MRSLSSREKMSNSRSPRAVRSMTMGTRGMALDTTRRYAAAGVPAPQPAEQALDPAADPAAVQVQRVGHVAGRRAVGQHGQQRQVLGVDQVGGGVELLAVERREREAAAGDDADRLEQLGAARPPCRPGRRRRRRAPSARPSRPCRGSRAGRAGSAFRRRHSASPSPSSRWCSSSTTSGRSRSTSSNPSSAPVAAPTGTRPGSVRSSIVRPARTAGWGSTMAIRVTAWTLPSGPELVRKGSVRHVFIQACGMVGPCERIGFARCGGESSRPPRR